MSQNVNFTVDPNLVKELCSVSEKYATNPNYNESYEGWKPILTDYNTRSNFKAVAFKKDNQIVVCYVGTSRKLKEAAKDWGANAKMVFRPSEQMKQANKFYQDLVDSPYAQNCNIHLGGGSEGGSEAQYVCIMNGGIPTYTYNAFMTGNLWTKEQKAAYNNCIINFRHPDDPVSKLGTDIGIQMIVPSASRTSVKQIGDVTYSHKLKNLGDCNFAIDERNYKRIHPNFAGKIVNTVITREDIANMSPETYGLYEDTLLLRATQKNGIPSENDARKMALTGDLVYVSDYTRDDGTHVESYYRKAPAH